MIKAINLLDNKVYEVKKYKNLYYIENDYGYIILKPCYKNIEEIEFGLLYLHYLINNKLYDSFYSTIYKPFADEIEQLSLF